MHNLILHIGNYKTGTTAVQNFFNMNRDRLLEHGILFPRSCYASDWQPRLSLGHTYFYRDLVGLCSGEIEKLEEEIEANAQNAHTTVISSENLFRATRDAAAAAEERLSDYNVTVVCYLRRQDTFINSIYHEFICSGWERLAIGPDEFLRNLETLTGSLLSYYENLQHWANAFGKEKLIVRAYEEKQLFNGNTVDDFAHLIGLEDLSEFRQLNELQARHSVPSEIAAALIPINQVRLPTAVYREALYIFYNNHLQRFADKPHRNFFSPLQREQILKRFELENRRIAEEFFDSGRESLFYTPGPAANSAWAPVRAEDPELIQTLWAIFLHVAAKHLNSIDGLQAKQAS